MPRTEYLNTRLLQHVLQRTAYPSPMQGCNRIYLALGALGGDGNFAECKGKGYQRVAFRRFRASNHNGIYDEVENVGNFRFPTADAFWPAMSQFAFFDAPQDGNMLLFAMLFNPISLASGNWINVRTGDFTIFMNLGNTGPRTDFGRKLLHHVFLAEEYPVPTPFAALKPAPSGAGYARVATDESDWDGPGDDGLGRTGSFNVPEFSFGTATADWGGVQVIVEDSGGELMFEFGAGGNVHAGDRPYVNGHALECGYSN